MTNGGNVDVIFASKLSHGIKTVLFHLEAVTCLKSFKNDFANYVILSNTNAFLLQFVRSLKL